MIDNMDVQFRKAGNEDVPAIQKVVFGVLAEYGMSASAQTDADIADIQKFYWDDNGYFAVMEDPEKGVVGSFGIMNRGNGVCEVRKMFFFKEYRGKGLGKKAMESLLEEAKKAGYHTVTLETARILKEAIVLYEKMGFKEDNRKKISERCDLTMSRGL